MDIVLRTNQTDPLLAMRSVTRFGDGSGFRVMLEVRSRGFQASIPFYFELQPLSEFLKQLVAMDSNLRGSARLKPMFEDPFVELTMTNTGRVIVSGELMEYSEHTQRLRFEFETDQTVLRPLIEDLKSCAELAAA